MTASSRDTTTLAERGVWVTPWLGPNEEIVLIAITADHRLVAGPTTVPLDRDHLDVADQMWDKLERVDPIPIAPPPTETRREHLTLITVGPGDEEPGPAPAA